MKLIAALVLLLAALTGCQPEEAPSEGPVPGAFVQQQKACEDRGGRWGRGGVAGFYVCYETTRDAGRSCSAGTQCEGLCLARSRTCTPVQPLYGCHDILMDNGSRGAICID